MKEAETIKKSYKARGIRMRKQQFHLGDGTIYLEKECIVGFRTLSPSCVECEIESRPYDTMYRLKCIDTYSLYWKEDSKSYFIQVRRVRR